MVIRMESLELKLIFSKVMGVPIETVDDDFSRQNQEWDSFNHLVLIAEIEKKANLQLSMEEVNKINTFKDLHDLIKGNGKNTTKQ